MLVSTICEEMWNPRKFVNQLAYVNYFLVNLVFYLMSAIVFSSLVGCPLQL